ncbi:MAG TPA: hypothetical protein VEP89_16115 [Draconibacterium sp.]|nr:hypothetical protein [Draconibacterium sp.]
MIIGIPLGIFIGLLSGYFFLMLVKTMRKKEEFKKLQKVIALMSALVVFSLGGSWFSTGFLEEITAVDILPSYLCSFTGVFVLICSTVIFQIAIQLGKSIREGGYNG